MIWQIAVSIQVLVYSICTVCGVHEGKKIGSYLEKIFEKIAAGKKHNSFILFRRWIYLAKELVLFQPEIFRKGAYFSYFIKERVSRKIEPFLGRKKRFVVS